MLELKIIRAANRMYRGILNLGLKSLNAKDTRNLKKLNRDLKYADDMRRAAQRMRRAATALEDTTNKDYATKSRDVTAAYNFIINARDDSSLT